MTIPEQVREILNDVPSGMKTCMVVFDSGVTPDTMREGAEKMREYAETMERAADAWERLEDDSAK